MPRVSVVIPAYNHARFVGEAVTSVLTQTLADVELIVVDDGSTDDTGSVLDALQDPRLRVIAQINRGAHAAINAGLAAARAPVLAILNSDDTYHPERLDRAAALLDNHPDVALVGSFIEVVDSVGASIAIKHGWTDLEPWAVEQPAYSFRAGTDPHAALLTENYWSTTSNFVFRRSYLDSVGEFRPLRYVHDWDFALRLAMAGRLVLLKDPLLRYRVHDSNTIREDQAAMVFEICWCLAVHLPQHIATEWFADLLPRGGAEQLLHSVHVFGCERVLAILLAYRLADDVDTALALLDPRDPRRMECLDFIGTRLGRGPLPDAQLPPATPGRRVRWGARLRRPGATRSA